MVLRIGGVPEHFNLPWHLALRDDAFAKAGAPIDYQEYPGGTGAMTQGLGSKQLDLALVLTEGGVADVINGQAHCDPMGNDKGNRLVKVYVRSPLIWGIHVAEDTQYTTVDQVHGARYAISRYGSGSHLMAIVDAALRGWSIADMKFVVVKDIDGARIALQKGQVDVFFWERFITQPWVDRGVFRRIGQRIGPWPAFVVCARHDVLKKTAGKVRLVLDIAERYAKNLQRREGAAGLIAETYGLKLEDAKAWFETVSWSGGYRRPTAALSQVIRSLRTLGIIEQQKIALDDVWYRL